MLHLLAGPIPKEVSKMTNLKWLDLRQNRLTGESSSRLLRLRFRI